MAGGIMKVAGVFGGLGSQMFKYAFYLNLKAQTQEKCYIDTSFFVTGSAWNGYELERIFQINAPDWKDELGQAALQRLELKQTDYQDEVLYAMQKRCGKVSFLCLGSVFGTFCDNKFSRFRFRCYKAYVYRVRMWLTARHLIHNKIRKKYLADGSNVYFEEFSHNSDLYFRGGVNVI